MVFGWAQIIMDIQPLFVLITGDGHLHGFSHTFAGATLLALFSAVSGKYLSEFGLKVLRISKEPNYIIIKWRVVYISAFIGTYSHVALDAIMHSDVEPYYPLSLQNGFLELISVTQLHQLCMYTGFVGAVVYYAVGYVHKKYNKRV